MILIRNDAATATPFESYARPHIRGAMWHYLRDLSLPIRLPRRIDELRLQLARLRREWNSVHHRDPSDAQIRRALGLKPSRLSQLIAAEQIIRVGSLDSPGGQMEKQALTWDRGPKQSGTSSRYESAPAPSPLQLLRSLEPRLQNVVDRVVLQGWSYRRTGEALGLSPMTVQRRLHKGVAQLRDRLSSEQECHPFGSAAPEC